jgi:hypothetical protein
MSNTTKKKIIKSYASFFVILSGYMFLNLETVEAMDKNDIIKPNGISGVMQVVPEDEKTDDSGGSREGSLSKRPTEIIHLEKVSTETLNQIKSTIGEVEKPSEAKKHTGSPFLSMLERFKARSARTKEKNAANQAEIERLYMEKVREQEEEREQLGRMLYRICSEDARTGMSTEELTEVCETENSSYGITKDYIRSLNISSSQSMEIGSRFFIEYVDPAICRQISELDKDLVIFRKVLLENEGYFHVD